MFTYWTPLLNCRHARGIIAPTWPDNGQPLILEASSPTQLCSAIDNRKVSSPVEEGAIGEAEGRFIEKKYEISEWVRQELGECIPGNSKHARRNNEENGTSWWTLSGSRIDVVYARASRLEDLG